MKSAGIGFVKGLVGGAAALVLLAASAQAQTPVADLSAGQPNGRYSFASWTPKTLPDLLKGNTQNEKVNIVGHLFLPPGSAKVPAVVLMHGSGGIYRAMLEFWPKTFNAEGYAVFSIELVRAARREEHGRGSVASPVCCRRRGCFRRAQAPCIASTH